MDFFIDKSTEARDRKPIPAGQMMVAAYPDEYINFRRRFPGAHSIEKVLERVKKNSGKIGFLSLFIENLSDSTLLDVEVTYELFTKKSPYEITNGSETHSAHRGSGVLKKKTVDHIKPNVKFLWLLSIYEKDNRGYERKYITDVIEPREICYRVDRRRQKVSIRPPSRELAAKTLLPFGWYHQ